MWLFVAFLLIRTGLKLIDKKAVQNILKRGVKGIIVEEELVKLLQSGRSLKLKMGFDPSRPDIHLGHVVGLRKLRQFQALGHQVILIVGDWTAQIGDPSGQSVTRPMLTHQEVIDNADSYMRQFFKVVDRDKTRVVWQSEWFGKFTLADVISLTRKFTVAQFLEREDFSQRFRSGQPIAITELLYPLLQAYDSIAVEADVEFGGTDQTFNLLVGRDLQVILGQPPQQCFFMPILVGTDGVQKMSKSLNNYIAVEDPPNDMYGKVMSIPDSVMMDYFEWLTDVGDDELSLMRRELADASVNPMNLKKKLANNITAQFHSADEAGRAQDHFERVVQRSEAPEDVREVALTTLLKDIWHGEKSKPIDVDVSSTVELPPNLILFYAGLTSSKGEARRLIAQGAVEVNGKTLDPDIALLAIDVGTTIKVGKRRFVSVTRDSSNS